MTGGLARARLRHHTAQAVLVTLLSGVVALCAVLGAAYARAVEESVQLQVLTSAAESDRGVAVSATAAQPPAPDELRAAVLPSLGDPAWGSPVAGASADGLVESATGPVLVPVTARDGVCGRLLLDIGRCPAAGEVLVSRRTAALLGTAVGRTLSVADASVSGAQVSAVLPGLRVVGVYAPHHVDDAYWFDRPAAATVPVTGDGAPVGGDALVVDWPTLRSGAWRTVTTTVDVPLRPAAVPIERAPAVRSALARVTAAAASAQATTRTQLPTVLDSVGPLRQQARAPLPLVALQVVLLSLVVLGYVASATTEQRRPEVALARLRGQQPLPTALGLVRELGVLVVAGCLVGGLLGWAAAALAARAWLAGGISVPLRWPMLLAVAGSALAGVVAVTLTAVPTVREPLITLLRAVPPRSSALRAGVADGAVVALCVAGVVTLLSGAHEDPTALLAPGLIALAGGLALSQVVVPAAVLLGRAALRRGALGTALAAVAVARRPSLRRLVAIVTVAVALLVFAVSASAVGADQRQGAAADQVGAAAVLTVTASGPAALRSVVARADPSGGYATPVLVARSSTDQGPRTVAVDPASFARTALWDRSGRPGEGAPAGLAALSQPRPAPVAVQGERVQVTTRFAVEVLPPAADEGVPGAVPAPVQRPVTLHLVLTDAGARLHEVDLGALRPGRQQLSAAVPCAEGCRLRRVEVRRTFGDSSPVGLDLVVERLRDDGGAVDLRSGDDGWTPLADGAAVGPDDVSGDGAALSLSSRSDGTDLAAQRADVPAYPPVLSAGDVPGSLLYSVVPSVDPRRLLDAPGPTGLTRTFFAAGSVASVPGARAPLVLMALRDLELDGELDPAVLQQLWLSSDDPARLAALTAELRRNDVEVTGSTTVTAVAAALGRQGPGAALRLAVVAGVIALVLAACVLAVSVATSGRVRARDLAGLRAVGVPGSVTRSAAVREQLVVAAVGVLSGALLGAVGVALTLTRRAPGQPSPDLVAAVAPASAAVVACAALLCGVCLLLGRRLSGSAVPGLLREGAR